MMNSGQAIVEAAAKVVEQGKQIASHALEASAGDIEFKDGKFVVAGTDRAIDIMELSQKIRAGMKLPPEGPQSLDVKHVSEGAPSAYPNGCHVCEVEIDQDTGNTEVVRYSAVNDFGTIINPMFGGRPEELQRGRSRASVRPCSSTSCMTSRASFCQAPTWITRCRARTTRRTSRC